MLADYGHIFLFILFGFGFSVVNLMLISLVRFHSKDRQQKIAYECGMEPVGSPYVRIDLRFYLFALLFVMSIPSFVWSQGVVVLAPNFIRSYHFFVVSVTCWGIRSYEAVSRRPAVSPAFPVVAGGKIALSLLSSWLVQAIHQTKSAAINNNRFILILWRNSFKNVARRKYYEN